MRVSGQPTPKTISISTLEKHLQLKLVNVKANPKCLKDSRTSHY